MKSRKSTKRKKKKKIAIEDRIVFVKQQLFALFTEKSKIEKMKCEENEKNSALT